MPVAEPEKAVQLDQKVVVTAIERAKAKNARLRLMKERNENYLAEQKDEHEVDDELTKELK
jgi:ribosomal protein S1